MIIGKSSQKNETLGYLGEEFQMRLIKIFLEDKDAFKNDMSFVNQNAFTNPIYRSIVAFIKDFVQKNDYIPSYELLSSLISKTISNDIDLQLTRETINSIKNATTEGFDVIKEESVTFFKQQELVKFFNEKLGCISRGVDVTQTLQDEISKILSIGKHDNIWTGVYDNFDETFSPESIVHIPVGCPEIDEYLQGGIIKSNLVLIAASSGIGKTSISTALAESAATFKCPENNNEGFKVMQIYFEDNHPAIRRKHMGSITEIEARFLTTDEYREEAKKRASEYEHKELIKNNIKLGRFRNGELTPQDLKQAIQLEVNKGFKPDMVIVDYFECMANPVVKNMTNEWKIETEKMRQLENLTRDFGCAIVVTTQGTKQSAEGMLMTLEKISGSAGKYQVGHCVITLNRTQKDADENRAELFIPKNREGKSGRAFKITLNNGSPKITVNEYFDDLEEMKEAQRSDNIKRNMEEHYGGDFNSPINKVAANVMSRQGNNYPF
jgi:replicative DNA helicase